MPRNLTTDTETNETEYHHTEELYRRSPYRLQTSTGYGHRNGRVTKGDSCLKCDHSAMQIDDWTKRKKKTKGQLQHCPSCHCPPGSRRFSSGKLRSFENVEALLDTYENHIAADPTCSASGKYLPGSQSSALDLHGKSGSNRYRPRRPNVAAVHRQSRKTTEHELLLNKLMQDMIDTGLANEETEGACGWRPSLSVKNVYKRENREVPPAAPDDSDTESLPKCTETRDRPWDLKGRCKPSNYVSTLRRDGVQQSARVNATKEEEELDAAEDETEEEDDEEWKLFKRDQRELNELNYELRGFAKRKETERGADGDDQRAEKQRQGKGDEDERLKRKVKFLPSKLPVAKFGNARLPSPSAVQNVRDQSKSPSSKIKATANCRLSTKDEKAPAEFHEDPVDYSEEQLQRELNSIPYCKPCSNPSAPTAQARKGKIAPGSRPSTERCEKNEQLISNPVKKNMCAGAGDLDLHATKSYIVDLIDRALSRELGTAASEEKRSESVNETPTSQEMCVEISRALQGDCYQSLLRNVAFQRNLGTPDYVRQLKILRWEHLNHIQDELRRLHEVERFLDTCSPRQSLPVLPSQTEPKREQQSTTP